MINPEQIELTVAHIAQHPDVAPLQLLAVLIPKAREAAHRLIGDLGRMRFEHLRATHYAAAASLQQAIRLHDKRLDQLHGAVNEQWVWVKELRAIVIRLEDDDAHHEALAEAIVLSEAARDLLGALRSSWSRERVRLLREEEFARLRFPTAMAAALKLLDAPVSAEETAAAA